MTELPVAKRLKVERTSTRRRTDASFAAYAEAMDWEQTAVGWSGRLGKRHVTLTEAHNAHVVAVTAPGVLPLIAASRIAAEAERPRLRAIGADWTVEPADPLVIELGSASPVTTNDPYFDRTYRVESTTPWFAHLMLSSAARDALLAAPAQDWLTVGTQIVGIAELTDEALEIAARASALAEVLESVPWEAYVDPRTLPGRVRVVAAYEARQNRLRLRGEEMLSRLD